MIISILQIQMRLELQLLGLLEDMATRVKELLVAFIMQELVKK